MKNVHEMGVHILINDVTIWVSSRVNLYIATSIEFDWQKTSLSGVNAILGFACDRFINFSSGIN